VVLERIATANPDCVIALPSSGLRDALLRVIRRVPCVTVAVHDTPENILERSTFYDLGSRPIDKHLTDEEQALYLKEIKPDISYFQRSYERADLHVTITGLGPQASAATGRPCVPAAGGRRHRHRPVHVLAGGRVRPRADADRRPARVRWRPGLSQLPAGARTYVAVLPGLVMAPAVIRVA
jgi:hypothetical protein